ncbi:zinc-binding domain-containing protein [Biscogniauxia sp. FL1348]|nr:zinc-binding domain-containing protein [Biscogniauxia sp. FL1348]
MAKGKLITYAYPSLHQRVVDAVSDQIAKPWYNATGSKKTANKEYPTNVMGKFKCNNNRCSKKGWSSKKVAITIWSYPMNGYNAIVWNQRCKSCNQLGFLTLDEDSYVERVAYRIDVWAGVSVTRPYYNEEGESLPHEKRFCEGCKAGVCPAGMGRGIARGSR